MADGEFVPLREYVDLQHKLTETKIDYESKLNAGEHKALEDARILALKEMDRHMSELNGFKKESQHDKEYFMTRAEFQSKNDVLELKIDNLRLNERELKGKADAKMVWIGYLFCIIGIILSVIAILR